MKQPIVPNYEVLQTELEEAHVEYHASEMHGLIAGVLCGDLAQDGLERLLAVEGLSKEAQRTLEILYKSSGGQLKDFLFEFNLILPGDEEPLPFRAESLTIWCQGFLMGLKLMDIPLQSKEPTELSEAIDDLIEIAKMNYEQVVANEEDEAAFVELVEYVRMAVILIYQDLRGETPDRVSEALQLH